MTVLVAALQQRIALAVVLVMVAGWVVYLIGSARRTYQPGSELEVAPNRKQYFDDDRLEGSRLTKYLWWAFAMLAISAVGLPAYWLREPYRQQGAGLDRGAAYFDEKAVERGRNYFQAAPGNPPAPREPHYGCETCHGVKGIGGVATYTITDEANPDAPARQVQWQAPALNTVMLRFRPEEVLQILTYGRAGTPMPAWGVEGGGALNEQQLEDLVAYLESITLDPRAVKEENLARYGTDGTRLFEAFCARCHTQGASYGEPAVPGGGALGPALVGGASLRQFPTVDSQVEWVGQTAPLGSQYGVRGQATGRMPFFGEMLAPEQVQAVAEYERGL